MSDISNDIQSAYNDLLLEAANELVTYLKGEAPEKTGALKNSIQATVNGNDIEVSYLRYGVYQDFGVKGWDNKNGPNASPFQFKYRNDGDTNKRPGPIGGSYGTYAGRVAIRKYGLEAKYWASNPDGSAQVPDSVVAIIEQGLADGIEIAVTKAIDEI